MRNGAALFGIGLALAGAAAVADAQGRARQDGARATWTVDGVARTAVVVTPRGTAPDAGWPVVFVFHGHGGSAQNASRSFRIHQHWPEALVVYPQGLPTPGRLTDPEGRRPGWQHAPGEQADRDLRFFDAMLETLARQYRVDARRVFAAGHSNGGAMVYTLWAARADRLRALAPSSASFLRLAATATPKPAFIVAGRQDALVPFATQERSLDATRRLNRATAEAVDWSGLARRYPSSVQADVVAYVHPGGHQLPDDAGALMVKFFKQF